MTRPAKPVIFNALARSIAPRRALTVSEWADANRILSSKSSPEPGPWRTDRNPLSREPMDCMSSRSPVKDITLKFPVQLCKSEVATNALGYGMDHDPGPIMYVLPGEVSRDKWITQKLKPLLEETPAVRKALTSTKSRDGANRHDYKEFAGGLLYVEHAGSTTRMKSSTVRRLIIDELDEVVANLKGDDPEQMLNERTSAYQSTYKRLKVSTPTVVGLSRITANYEAGDQRKYYVPCPHCGHRQPLEWSGLHWNASATECWYVCCDCGACIEEHEKTRMIARGAWVPQNPDARARSYTANGLYYSIGLGPRWLDLVHEWLSAQNDPTKLKTFLNSRLAEAWEDPAMRRANHNAIKDRVEPRALKPVPDWVLWITAGVDTQDDRLEVQLVGWGHLPGGTLRCWPIDYVKFPGDPADEEVWVALTEYLNRPIDHASGAVMRVDAVAQDIYGHRTEAVKAYARKRLIRRYLPIFGATSNNAPVLGRGKLVDINWKGKLDKRGVRIYAVGTVGIKHLLYGHLSTDADKEPDKRVVRFSDELGDDYLGGLVSEVYNPTKNRFEKRKGGPRNEPLDTWVYAYAATHHPELRLHRLTAADWERRAERLRAQVAGDATDHGKDGGSPNAEAASGPSPKRPSSPSPTSRTGGFGKTGWGFGNGDR